MDKLLPPQAYNRTFEDFNHPLMRRFRELAYGEDIGQHSWTSAAEIRDFCASMRPKGSIIDFGCGAGGPLTCIVQSTEGSGTGCDISEPALEAARGRAKQMGLSDRVSFFRADCDAPISLASNQFDTAISIDVLLHLRDRCEFLRQVNRVLKPGGTFIFTDAGIETGVMTDAERKRRTLFGHTEFVRQGVNERSIATAGLMIEGVVDSTSVLITNASGRLRARQVLSKELSSLEGAETFRKQLSYLETVVDLAQRGVLSRFTYTCSAQGTP
jgi:ubiquinone/menaquinone biosynthesis C-methylase UbiE